MQFIQMTRFTVSHDYEHMTVDQVVEPPEGR